MKFLIDLLSRVPIWAIKEDAAVPALLGLQRAMHLNAGLHNGLGVWEAAKPRTMGTGAGKVAVVPIQGVLTMDGPSWYGSNYNTIGESVEAAAGNPEVKHIVLAVDSPGGEVTGVPETAALIAAAAKIKPVSAIVEGQSASAAYYLTSQARDIALTPSGEVGSVGVRMMHLDVSNMMDDWGVKVTELYSGDFKTEWSPYKPLSADAKEAMLPRLQEVHAGFVNAVQAGRGPRLSQYMREKRIGEGRMFSSSDALLHGMVDKLQSSRDFFRALLPPQEAVSAAFPLHSRHEIERAKAEG
ncbi:MAG TPA: S49 family peptidase [Terracidiphilus sp.]|nr:S49 family peptidase [Terracidiphilus sp.]